MPNDIKQVIMDEIQKKSDVFIRVSPIRVRIRCPICGDSQKNLKDAHCYIKCSNDPTEPILYNCFLCNSGGRVGKWFLNKLGVDPDISNQLTNKRYNKLTASKKGILNVSFGEPQMKSPQVEYLKRRLGCEFTHEDLDAFKIVWTIPQELADSLDVKTRNTFPSKRSSILFLSDDRSMFLARSFLDDGARWRKIRLFDTDTKSFYTIKAQIDLFTQDTITVNIAEGVMDVLSAYKNFNKSNSAYIATVGSNYVSAIDYAISKGLIGKNIDVNIYIDQDIDEKQLKQSLKQYKWLFNKITILKNLLDKDIGVPIDRIKLSESRV